MNVIDNLISLFSTFNTHHKDDYLGALYVEIFHKTAHTYKIFYDAEGKLTYVHGSENFHNTRKQIKKKIDSRALLKNFIEKRSDKYYIFCYSTHEWIIANKKVDRNSRDFLIQITLNDDADVANYYEDIFCDPEDINYIFDDIKSLFVESIKEEKVEFGIAAISADNYLYTSWYEYKEVHIDIDKNYNDDFIPPYNKICNIIKNDESASLMLLYGDPGTGKTSLIKHLICKYPEKDFVFIDGSLLLHASQERLMTYFLENQNTIFILEDCEKALMSRDKGYNPVMTTILNVTDGVIADVLGIKLICTFNTSLSNIDKALLRKGRLSLKYEFKKLCKEKVRKILGDDTINEDMSLADIYNYKEENDYSKKASGKIGFT